MRSLALPLAAPSAFIELTKPRIVALVLVTVSAGFVLAPGSAPAVVLLHVLIGTALVAAGTNALNQLFEREHDARMRRTAGRPLPSGRLTPIEAGLFAWGAGVSGVVYLAAAVNELTALLAALTLASYVFLYTPLKRRTTMCTLVGAVPGALPIAGGWAAATGELATGAWLLFCILFLWQLPHFLALSWLYREDYERAGFVMPALGDPDGRATFGLAALYAAALIPATMALTAAGIGGPVYAAGALLLSIGMLAAALLACHRPTPVAARRLFLATLAYLPLVLILLVGDHIS